MTGDRFDEFVEGTNIFRDCDQAERKVAANILRKYFNKPVVVPVACASEDFSRWLEGYPANHENLMDILEGSAAHHEAIGEMIFKTREMCRSAFAEISSFLPKAANVNSDAFYESIRESGILRENVVANDIQDRLEKLYDAPIPNDCIQIYSSQGEVYADTSGRVVSLSGPWRNAEAMTVPLKFDFPEYEEYWNEKIPQSVDILDLGFVSACGECVPPAMDWREEIRAEQRDQPGMRP